MHKRRALALSTKTERTRARLRHYRSSFGAFVPPKVSISCAETPLSVTSVYAARRTTREGVLVESAPTISDAS